MMILRNSTTAFILLLMVLSGAYVANFTERASAETVVRAASEVAIQESQRIDSDFYGLSETLIVAGSIAGDVYAAASEATVSGQVAADVTLIGGVVAVSGEVSDDVRVFGGEVTITESVGGDVFVIGRTLTVPDSTSITGDVYFYGDTATIEGSVGGGIHGNLDQLRIDSAVGGSVDVVIADELSLGARSVIAGDVTYTDGATFIQADESVVNGMISSNVPDKNASNGNSISLLVPFLIHLFTLFLIFFFARRRLMHYTDSLAHTLSAHGTVGVLAFGGMPLLLFLLAITIVGIFASILALFGYITLLLCAYLIAPVTFFALVRRVFGFSYSLNLLSLPAAVAAFYLIGSVVVVGPVTVLLSVVLALGGITYGLYTRLATYDKNETEGA